jgi:hypothetical protein
MSSTKLIQLFKRAVEEELLLELVFEGQITAREALQRMEYLAKDVKESDYDPYLWDLYDDEDLDNDEF